MDDLLKTYDLQLKVEIGIAFEPLAKDIAMTDLWADNHDSKYTKESFIKEISNRNVIVALLRDDPIAYAIKKDGEIIEHYIEWAFRDSNLEQLLLQS